MKNLNFSKIQNELIDNFFKNLVILRHQFIEIVIVISVVIILILCIFLKRNIKNSKILTDIHLNFELCRNLIFWFGDFVKRSLSESAYSTEYFRPPPCYKTFPKNEMVNVTRNTMKKIEKIVSTSNYYSSWYNANRRYNETSTRRET